MNVAVLPAYLESMRDFRSSVTSIDDIFGLLREDPPELPRYLRGLAACERESRRVDGTPRLCDLGGYFGIFGAAARSFGYEVDVVDTYGEVMTAPQHADLRAWWAKGGIRTHDIDLQHPDLRLPLDDASVDVVTLLAVIEHFPSSPRLVLEEARRILKPGGLLVVDTPNAGAFGVRVGFLLHGEGIWAPVSDLYHGPIPFPGHTRCYSRRELVQVMTWAGFEVERVDLFDLEAPAPGEGRLPSRILYGPIYRTVQRARPDLRGYLWVSGRRPRAH